jgi:hypothetical protein
MDYNYRSLLHCMSPVMADIVAKLFLAFERATLIQNQMPMRQG